MKINLINKDRSYIKVGNTVSGINLDDLIVLEEAKDEKYKIYSPNHKLSFNKIGNGFDISIIKDKNNSIIKQKY